MGLALSASQLPPPAAAEVDFARDIEPLLRIRCQGCHGAAQQMSGLRLDSGEAAMKGGYSGPVIKTGNSAESRLIRLVAGLDAKIVMPPAGPRLTPQEIGLLRTWIDQGAQWPASQTATAEAAPKQKHWAFQPIGNPNPPATLNHDWPRNPIDQFILERLEQEGIDPSPEAPKTTLLRRVSLDLIGLPPSPDETRRFLNDNRPDAYEREVDRLLESPHFGEKWARNWLDLAGYAETPHAWRWRHWVIQALNRDQAFDQFTIEQIAGDLIPHATVDQKVATGFHRNSATNPDWPGTVAKVWLGLTVDCAQSHERNYGYQLCGSFDDAGEAIIDAPLPGEIGPYLRAESKNGNSDLALSQAAVLKEGTGRLTLARWLVSSDNPLTPRVTVNRIWHELFGRGLVHPSENFGPLGERPSHPELLDWLASRFVKNGWSRKQMIHLIVTAAAYRQASEARPELTPRDPNNALLARQSRLRLPAGLIRDSALFVSDLLNPTVGGKADTGERYRRSIYVPPTDPEFAEAAKALAERVLRETPQGDLHARIDRAFRICLMRRANSNEQESFAKLHIEQIASVLLNLDEFNTRE